MARWRLQTAHYLNVPGTEWEHKETDKQTGRQGVKRFPVPMFLDPRDSADHNYRELGEIIVAHVGKGQPRDIFFEGPPTPDMEPLDEEATAITAEASKKWQTKPEVGSDYSQSLLAQFGKQVEDALAKQVSPLERVNLSEGMVTRDEFAQLQSQMKALIDQNSALIQALASKAGIEKRV